MYIKFSGQTKIILLFLVNILVTINQDIYLEIVYLGLLLFLYFLSSQSTKALKFMVFYVVVLGLQYYLFLVINQSFVFVLSILVIGIRKICPCVIAASFLISTTRVSEIIAILTKWKIPKKIIIPIVICFRYMPIIKQEISNIFSAMKMRDMKNKKESFLRGVEKKVEYIYVPLLINASKTAEDLTDVALLRGITNPATRTSLNESSMYIRDYFVLTVYFSILGLSVFLRMG